MIIRFLFLLTILFPQVLWGQPPFTNYSIEDGLPTNECNSVSQDNLGYIWIATNVGLSKFDGYEFKRYTSSNGLPTNQVLDLYKDSKERLWIISLHYQPVYLFNGEFHYVPIDPEQKLELDDYFIKKIKEAEDGKILITYHGQKVYEYDPKTDLYKKVYDFYDMERFVPVFFMRNDSNLIISSGGTTHSQVNDSKDPYLYKGSRGHKHKLNRREGIEAYMKVVNHYTENDGMTVFQLHPDSLLYTIRNDSIIELAHFDFQVNRWFGFDPTGNFWIGMNSQGVYIYENANFSSTPKQVLDGYTVTSRFIDKEGNYWYSTLSNGLFFTPNEDLKFYDAELFNSSKLRAVAGIENKLYLSTQEHQLYSLNIEIESIKSDEVLYIINLNDTAIIVSSSSLRFTSILPSNERSEFSNIAVESLYESDSVYYIGFRRRLYAMRKGQKEFYNNLLVGKFIYSITSYQNKILIGTEQGIYLLKDSLFHNLSIKQPKEASSLFGFENHLYDHNDTVLMPYGSKFHELQGVISGMEVFNGFLAISIPGKGVYFFDGDSIKYRFERNSEFLDNYSSGLYVSSKGKLYSYGLNGFASYSYDPEGGIKRNTYSQLDGTGWRDLIGMHEHNDSIWLVSKNGVCIYKKSNYSIPLVPPRLYFEDVWVNQNLLDKEELLNLSHIQNNLRIDFKALSYRSLKNLTYRYRINESEWIISKATNINFPSLPHGEYTLEIIAENPWGQKSNTAILKFDISPPFYLEWWFIMIEFILVGGLLYMFLRWRIKQISSRAMINLEKYQNKHLALNAQLNPHFIFNSLNAIDQLVNKYESSKSSEYLKSFAMLMRQTLENSKSQLVSLKTDIDLLKEFLRLELLRFDNDIELIYDIEQDLDLDQYYVPPMLLQPFVENVFQHAWPQGQSSKQVIIGLKKMNGHLYMYVEDNGVGVNGTKNKREFANKEHNSSGMSISSSRIDLFNKLYEPAIVLSIESVNKKGADLSGTRVSLLIPLKMNLRPLESIK